MATSFLPLPSHRPISVNSFPGHSLSTSSPSKHPSSLSSYSSSSSSSLQNPIFPPKTMAISFLSLPSLPLFSSSKHPSSLSSSSSSSSPQNPIFQTKNMAISFLSLSSLPLFSSSKHPSSTSSCSCSSSSSPFTEKDSAERFQRDSWLYQGTHLPKPSPVQSSEQGKESENDISLQLPELRVLLELLKEKMGERGEVGNVSLVGTGPGDPELLTLKAVRVIEAADLILYDRLVSHEVLGLVRPDARLLYVGKTSGYHSRTQEEIHQLLLNFAEAGANVVRLKGGDPLIFGRGGEEIDFLQQQGIRVKVVPGITSASGIAAELGIPLTHRGIANSIRFLTGHSRNGGTDPLFVAENAADPEATLVVYMGLSTLPSLAERLMSHGLVPETPAAAVERGTTPQQRVVFAELDDLANKVEESRLISPALIIIGGVVALSPYWPKPLDKNTQLKSVVRTSEEHNFELNTC